MSTPHPPMLARYRQCLMAIFPLLLLLPLSLLLLIYPTDIKADSNTLKPLSTETHRQVWVLKLSGGIGPASSDFVIRSLEKAIAANAQLLVIELDTPGGLDTSMRELIKQIIASPIPIATFVYPSGSRAASAGTYILYASHIAAMAPATNLGAASPVQIGGPGLPATPKPTKPITQPQQPNKGDQEQPSTKPPLEDNATTLRRKVMNDATAYIQGLAELHGRNVDWAESAVRDAESISAEKALELGVIDLVATDLSDLLQQINGRVVKVQNLKHPLHTDGMVIQRIEPDWRNQFLLLITNPNIAYILMMIGFYGLLLEFYHPGVGLPGILGGICLLIALYAFQLLPISYTGLALILLGIALMAIEALSPSIGIFGFGGVIAFAIGSVMLMDSDLPGYQIAMPIIAAFSVASLLFFLVILAGLLKVRRKSPSNSDALLVGQHAIAIEPFHGEGRVSIQGEIWNAHSTESINEGDTVAIQAIESLVLEVRKLGEH